MTLQWYRKAQLHSHYPTLVGFYHTEIFRRHVLTQPHAVLGAVESHTALGHRSSIDPEYHRSAVAASYRNRRLKDFREMDMPEWGAQHRAADRQGDAGTYRPGEQQAAVLI